MLVNIHYKSARIQQLEIPRTADLPPEAFEQVSEV
jgi:hypothetical protein